MYAFVVTKRHLSFHKMCHFLRSNACFQNDSLNRRYSYIFETKSHFVDALATN